MAQERTERSFCRTCQAFCGTRVTIADDRIVRVRGDRDDPFSRGYACFKGLQAPEFHDGKGRLRHSLLRRDGRLEPVASDIALAEAGARLKAIVDRHGPASVGFFMGTQSLFNTLDQPMIVAFAKALGTPRLFATMTIDQSAKWIGEARLGTWDAGPQTFDTADTWMMFGSNPLVSMVAGAGANHIAFPNPVKKLRDARARGLKLIVVDPRRSESAELADLHLQPRPGVDALIAAGVLQVILREGWIDRDFCDAYVDGLDALHGALAGFAPERRADEIGVSCDSLIEAAAMFARDSTSGMAGTGTGTDMARHSNLAEHLVQAINVVCGRFPREGDPVANPGVLVPRHMRHAEVRPLVRDWEKGPRTLAHGLGPIHGTMMSSAIADEILHPGPERMRALICVGGNPAVALPDQRRALAALDALELLIVIDPRLTVTAARAHVVIAPTLQYERADHSGLLERMFQSPFAHATAALVPPPKDADVVDDGFALWSLARDLGLSLVLAGELVPMNAAPSRERLLAMLAAGSQIPLADVAATEGGAMFAPPPAYVGPRRSATRFQLLPDDVRAEIGVMAEEPPIVPSGNPYAFQLIVRRHRELMNSTGADLEATWRRLPGNPAYLHPDDIAALGWAAGDEIEIARGADRIAARLAGDITLRRGVLSTAHCWPGIAERPEEATNALVDPDDGDVQAINRMPVMTGMTVTLGRRGGIDRAVGRGDAGAELPGRARRLSAIIRQS